MFYCACRLQQPSNKGRAVMLDYSSSRQQHGRDGKQKILWWLQRAAQEYELCFSVIY